MAVFFLLGNTNIKVMAGEGGMESFPVDAAGSALPAVLEGHRGGVAVAACVNPLCEPILAAVCRQAGLAEPVYAGRHFPLGVTLEVDNPQAVGVDRILNVKAAYARSGAASTTVDFGTAVSISVCDDDGRFRGGAIFPGVGLSLRSLADATALLPEIAPARAERALGTDTQKAMLSGVYFGALGAVREIIERIGAEMDRPLAVFLTGGDAVLFEKAVPRGWGIVPDLTMEGLRLAYEESR